MKVSINDANVLVIEIDLNTKGAISKSGKSNVIASTEGFKAVSTAFGIAKLGLNLITTDAAWVGGKAQGPRVVAAPGLRKAAS